MKKNNIARLIFLLLVPVCLALCACSSSEDNTEDTSLPDDKTTVEKVLNKACTEWGVSQQYIASYMDGYKEVPSSTDISQYINKDASLIISYRFADGGLVTTTAITPKLNNSSSLSSYLSGYSRVGDLSGTSVYSNISENTLCASYDTDFDGSSYSVLGFTPILSDKFTAIDPIAVTTGEATNIDVQKATLSGKITGISASCTCGIYYSTSSDVLASNPASKSTTSNGQFSIDITGLSLGTTYYYVAYVKVDGYYYYGETQSFQTLTAKTYAVGDLYPDENSPEGMVWTVDNDGLHGKIISLDQTTVAWDDSFAPAYNKCLNASNGYNNKMSSGNPFAKWCYGHGDGWYGPAKNELTALAKVASTVNTKLVSHGYAKLENFFWSSTEYSATAYNLAYIVCVCANTYMGYSSGWSSYNSKSVSRRAVAMKQF